MQKGKSIAVRNSVTDAPKKGDKMDIIMRLYNSCSLSELSSLENHVIAMRKK